MDGNEPVYIYAVMEYIQRQQDLRHRGFFSTFEKAESFVKKHSLVDITGRTWRRWRKDSDDFMWQIASIEQRAPVTVIIFKGELDPELDDESR